MSWTHIYFKQAHLICAFILLYLFEHSSSHSESTKLLVVSFDGFRHDYLDKARQAGKDTSNFDTLISNGVLAHHMKNAFITKTFPNHWTLATGLYEENHGVVANEMHDAVFNETYRNSPDQRRESKWWNNGTTGHGGEPIWFTNEKHHGHRSGVMFWPGSQAKEFLPFEYLPYDQTYPFESRINNTVRWFATENNPINFGMMYFDQPDTLGHEVGPSDPRMMDKIEELDQLVGVLIRRLDEHHLFKTMNLIITSDHGMSDIKNIIVLDDYVDPSLYTHFGSTPVWNILPTEGNETLLYESLKKVPNVDVYLKKDIPEEYHYKYNRRIQPILLVAHDHYEIVHTQADYDKWQEKGNHGFNNSLDDMHPIFIAHGPAFKKNHVFMEPFRNVDLYPLFCHILDIDPHVNDGELAEIDHILRGADELNTTLIISVIAIVFCAALAALICIGACRTQKAKQKRRLEYKISMSTGNGKAESNAHLLSSDEEEIP